MTEKEKIRAEIERRIEEEQRIRREKEKLTGVGSIIDTRYESLLSFIDSMQEEVDLDKEVISWKDISPLILIAERLRTDVYLSKKRITPEDFYKEVLKRFKAQKGE